MLSGKVSSKLFIDAHKYKDYLQNRMPCKGANKHRLGNLSSNDKKPQQNIVTLGIGKGKRKLVKRLHTYQFWSVTRNTL